MVDTCSKFDCTAVGVVLFSGRLWCAHHARVDLGIRPALAYAKRVAA